MDTDYVTPKQSDEAARVGLAFRMMVVAMVVRYDFGGISMRTRRRLGFGEIPLDYEYKKLQELIDKGYLGVKTGRGFDDYKGRSEEEILKWYINITIQFKLTKGKQKGGMYDERERVTNGI